MSLPQRLPQYRRRLTAAISVGWTRLQTRFVHRALVHCAAETTEYFPQLPSEQQHCCLHSCAPSVLPSFFLTLAEEEEESSFILCTAKKGRQLALHATNVTKIAFLAWIDSRLRVEHRQGGNLSLFFETRFTYKQSCTPIPPGRRLPPPRPDPFSLAPSAEDDGEHNSRQLWDRWT